MMHHTQYDASTCTWSGQQTAPMYHPDVSVAQVVLDALYRRSTHIGQISATNERRLPNGELRLNAIRVAQHLDRRWGVRNGDVIGFVAKNQHDLAAVVLGCMALAAPINSLDPNFKQAEIVHMFGLTQPTLVFCDPENIATVRGALAALNNDAQCFTFGASDDEAGARVVDELLQATGDEHLFIPRKLADGRKQALAIVCSSGTMGDPKGVCISHATMLEQMTKSLDLTADDVLLNFSSLYWLTGLGSLISGMMRAITRIITIEPFSAALMLRLIEQYGVTMLINAPSQLALLLQCPALHTTNLTTLTKYYVGGSVVAEELCERINRHLPVAVRQLYGMSEVAGTVATNDPPMRKPCSVGQLVHGLSVCIRDVVDDRRCGPGEDGEISIWMDPPFLGYWKNAAATERFFDADGWMRTGDLGHFDDDGYLYVVDRKKDILKYCAYQISPSELENVVMRTRGVAAVCVVGIPDKVATDLPAALIVRSEPGAGVTEQQICAIIKENLSDSKQLRGGVYFVDALPTTHSGKVMRRKVQEIAIELYNERNASSTHL